MIIMPEGHVPVLAGPPESTVVLAVNPLSS